MPLVGTQGLLEVGPGQLVHGVAGSLPAFWSMGRGPLLGTRVHSLGLCVLAPAWCPQPMSRRWGLGLPLSSCGETVWFHRFSRGAGLRPTWFMWTLASSLFDGVVAHFRLTGGVCLGHRWGRTFLGKLCPLVPL